MNYLIWWLSQIDCDRIEEAALVQAELNLSGTVEKEWLEGVPEYISVEYFSLLGRAGRNRLWVASSLNLPYDFRIEWKDDSVGAQKLSFDDYGGIVIRAEDKGSIIHLPGIVTDLELHLIGE